MKLSLCTSIKRSRNFHFITRLWKKCSVDNICALTCFVCQSVWNGKCSGNTMWSSLWSSAIPYDRNLYLWSHHISPFSLCTDIYSMVLHRRISCNDRPRPFNLTRSWNLLNLAHSRAVSICNSPIAGPVLADPKFAISNAFKLGCCSGIPHTSILGVDIQVWIRKWRSSIRHWFVVLA